MHWLAAIIVTLFAVIGVGLTMLTLPGIWVAILAAALCQWWQGDLYSWWTLGAAAIVGVVAEVADLGASAIGAAKVGGTRRGAIGSLIGAIVGAVLGSPIFFPLGTVLGAAVGAGVGAIVMERHGGRKTWAESVKIGGGAAAGRLAATVMKVLLAIVVGAILVVGAFV
jgi:uncharacterized protein YqgC (DUF456 family)